MQKNFRVFEDLPLRPLSLFQSKSEVAAKMAPCATPGKVTAGDDGVKIICNIAAPSIGAMFTSLMLIISGRWQGTTKNTKASIHGISLCHTLIIRCVDLDQKQSSLHLDSYSNRSVPNTY